MRRESKYNLCHHHLLMIIHLTFAMVSDLSGSSASSTSITSSLHWIIMWRRNLPHHWQSAPPQVLSMTLHLIVQNAVLAVFPGGSLIPSTGEGLDDGFGRDWTRRRERLRNLRELMRGWVVPLPLACHGLLGMMESEGTTKVERLWQHIMCRLF